MTKSYQITPTFSHMAATQNFSLFCYPTPNIRQLRWSRPHCVFFARDKLLCLLSLQDFLLKMYRMYLPIDPDEHLCEELYLKAMVAPLLKQMKKTIPFFCEGCKVDSPTQLEHDCLNDFNFNDVRMDHLNMAAPKMINKYTQVYARLLYVIVFAINRNFF